MKRWLAVFLCGCLLGGCTASGRRPGHAVPGRLAYERDEQVLIREGGREIAIGPGNGPRWSADGQWLAYIGSGERLRIARFDGTAAAPPPKLTAHSPGAWAPVAPALAVGAGDGLWVVRPEAGSSTEVVLNAGQVSSLSWSPDGRRIAYTTMEMTAAPPPVDTMWTVDAGGGSPARVLRDEQNGLTVTGWWPDGKGLFYWLFPAHSSSIAADGVPLMALPLEGGAPQKLTEMLPNPHWLAPAPDGRRFLAVTGTGRMAWVGKSLSLCDTRACQPLAQPAGVVTLDPAWSPRGDRIAFVRAEARPGTDSGQGWMETRTLWTANADGSGAREVKEAGAGVYSPMWAKDGRHLLYARGDTLWWIDTEGGAPVAVARLTAPEGLGYYGQVSAPVVWYQP